MIRSLLHGAVPCLGEAVLCPARGVWAAQPQGASLHSAARCEQVPPGAGKRVGRLLLGVGAGRWVVSSHAPCCEQVTFLVNVRLRRAAHRRDEQRLLTRLAVDRCGSTTRRTRWRRCQRGSRGLLAARRSCRPPPPSRRAAARASAARRVLLPSLLPAHGGVRVARPAAGRGPGAC